MLNRISTYILESRPESGPFVVGITGMDASGKSQMTTLLAQELQSSGISVQVVRLDDFHRPRAERYRKELPDPVQYYEHSFDYQRLIDEVLTPIRNEGHLETSLMCLNLLADTWTVERSYTVTDDTVVLLDGVFLFRPEIAHFLDLVIFLQVHESTVIDRATKSDIPGHGEEIMLKYQSKYLPAQRSYLEEYPSGRNADIILDNNNWEDPIIIKWPQ